MKIINVRQLLREFNSIFPIPEDGIQVVGRDESKTFYIYGVVRQDVRQYNVPKATPSVRDTGEDLLLDNDFPEKKEEKKIEKVEMIGELRGREIWVHTGYGYCEQHFEKGVKYKLYRIIADDFNGDMVVNKLMCENCMKEVFRKMSEAGSIRSVEKNA